VLAGSISSRKKLIICVREKFRYSWKIVRTITVTFASLNKRVKVQGELRETVYGGEETVNEGFRRPSGFSVYFDRAFDELPDRTAVSTFMPINNQTETRLENRARPNTVHPYWKRSIDNLTAGRAS